MMDKNFLGDQSYLLPLYTREDVTNLFSQVGRGTTMGLVPNLSSQALAKVPKVLEDATARNSPPLPTEIFGYLYGVLHSPIYRSTFLEYLHHEM